MKKYTILSGLLAWIFVFTINFNSVAQVNCTGATPFFFIDLTGDPAGVWTSPSVVRNGSCCGGGANQVNCIELAIILDPSAVGIQFQVETGANPGGALYFQINCNGVPQPSGAPICLDGPGPHYISYCKVGNNQNTYSLTSIPGATNTGDVITADGCEAPMSVTGLIPSTITWNSVSPGAPGEYNGYLQNPDGSIVGTTGVPFPNQPDVVVVPGPGYPSVIEYEVCGTIEAPCGAVQYCETVSVEIYPNLFAEITPQDPAICFGANSVQLTANPIGGTAPFFYEWSSGQSTQSINATSPGTYSVTITDASNCAVGFDEVVVTQFNVPISANAGPDINLCQGQSGAIAINGSVQGVTGGTWSGGAGVFSPSASSLSMSYTPTQAELDAGVLNLTLTPDGALGCPVFPDQMQISFSEASAAVLNVTDVTCFGGANGSVLLSGSGGVSPYQFSLNGGPFQSSNTFNNLTANTYTATVMDAIGCTATVQFTVNQPNQLTFSSVPQSTSCNGVCDGQILINPVGGTAPYQFSSNNGLTFSPTNPITGLCAGTIQVVILDNNNCIANANVVVPQPAPLTATYAVQDPICHGDCNGQVTVTPSGGTAPYSYAANADPYQPGSTVTGLCAGYSTIYVEDANGCSINSVQMLTNPPLFDINMVSMSESNCGFNNGILEVEAIGLNPPFQYSLNGGPNQATGEYPNLIAGAYEITVTDALGCQQSTFFGVNDIEMEGILLEINDVTCYGECDGDVEVINVSGSPPITYELDNQGATQTNGYFGALCAGSHIVTIYDGGFCIYTIPFVINEPDEIQFFLTPTNVSCNGGSDGQISVDGVIGGVGNYQYSIDFGFTFQASNVFTGLSPGMHTIAVMDDNNCMVFNSITIGEPTPMTYTDFVFHLNCLGDNTGFIQLDGSGGTPSYQYSIDNGNTFSAFGSFVSLGAADYQIVVQDSQGCQVTGITSVTQPAELLVAGTIPTDALCFESCDGQVIMDIVGGTAPYVISFDGGVTNFVEVTQTGLCQDTYSILVTDDNGCTATDQFDINYPTQVEFLTTVTPSTCGLPNGEVVFDASGGTPDYQYSIDDGLNYSASPTFGGLDHGSLNVSVIDNNGCEAEGTISIDNLPSAAITNIVLAHPLCFQSCDGSLTVQTSGGTGQLTYDIGSGPQVSPIFNNLCEGIYTVVVTDENGCETTMDTELISPPLLEFTTNVSDLTCYQNNTGFINVMASGGTPQYSYSFNGGSTFGPGSSSFLMSAGTYDIVVEDANNCTTTSQVVIGQPTELIINTVDVTIPSCVGYCDGTGEVFASGGTVATDYNYLWYDTDTINISSLFNVADLCAGVYYTVVTDDNGCWKLDSIEIVNPPMFIIADVIGVDPLCYESCDGEITIVSADAVEYSFDNGTTMVVNSTETGFCEGTYVVQAYNANGCLADTTVTITHPTELTLDVFEDQIVCPNELVTLTSVVSGGTEPYDYLWTGGSTDNFAEVSTTADQYFTVTVTDANGCSIADSVLLTLTDPLIVSVPNDTIICPFTDLDLAVTVLSGTPDYTYFWEAPLNSNSNQVTVNVDELTSFVVHVTDECETQVFTINVDVFTIPEVTFTLDAAGGCAPHTAEITPNLGPEFDLGSCVWTLSDGTVINDCGSISHLFPDPDCYDIELFALTTDGCEATGTESGAVCVFPNPEIEAFEDQVVCPNELVTLTSVTNNGTEPYDYLWTGGSTNSSAVVSTTANQYFAVTVTDVNGCTDADSVLLTLTDPLIVSVPNDTIICPFTDLDLTVTAISGTPNFTYFWEAPLNSNSNQVTVNVDELTSFVVHVTDECETQVFTINVDVFAIPEVTFTLDATGGCAPHTAEVTPNLGPEFDQGSCVWTLSDGTVINNCGAISHLFAVPDCYDIELFALTTDGCEATGTQAGAVCVYPNPEIEAFEDQVVCPNELVTLTSVTNNGTEPYDYLWTGGSTNSSAVVSTTANQYFAVTVTDVNGCTDADSVLLTLTDPLIVSVPNDTIICPSTDLDLTVTPVSGTPNYIYFWEAPLNSNSNQVTVNVDELTSFVVHVTDECETQVFTINVDVFTIPEITFTPDDQGGCAPYTANVSPNLGPEFDQGSCVWTISDGTVINSCDPISILFPTADCYDIELMALTTDGCTAIGTQSSAICVYPVPDIAVYDDQVVCPNELVTLTALATNGTNPYDYVWSSGDVGNTAVVSTNQNQYFSVVATDANGCTAADSVLLTLATPLVVSVPNDTIICPNTDFTMVASVQSGNPNYTFQWSPSGINADQITINIDQLTTYTVEVSDQCETQVFTIDVDVFVIPDITFTPNFQSGCAPFTAQIVPNLGPEFNQGNCVWVFSNGVVINGCGGISHTFTTPGCYDIGLTAVTDLGCVVTGYQYNAVCVYPNPVAEFTTSPTNPTIFNPDITFINLSTGADSYNWDFGALGSTNTFSPTLNLEGLEPGYTFTACLDVATVNGCVDQTCRVIEVKDEFVVYVPNAFTPNSDVDDYNNIFLPVFPPSVEIHEYNLLIFNRWGEILYESMNYKVGWPGTFAGQVVQDGVYIWKIELTEGENQRRHNFIGHVTLIR